MPILNVYSSILIYDDASSTTSNPKRRLPDWKFTLAGEEVVTPQAQSYEVLPGATLSAFSGTRTLTIDGTTEFTLALSTISSATGLYRLTSGAGTTPAFRTDRALALNTEVVTITVNNNVTVDFALSSISAGTFAAVSVGDVVFVPGTTTGDAASPFNVLNEGFWQVLAKGAVSAVANKKLTLRRLTGEDFSGVAESVTLTANSQLQAFSAAGVQVGDTVEISAGFSTVTQKSYIITKVGPKFIEFVSTDPLPLESSVIPTATGLVVYSSAKRFLRVEVDQEAALRFNGDTGNSNRLAPRTVGDPESVAYMEKWGPVWSLDVVNRSLNTMNVTVISAE